MKAAQFDRFGEPEVLEVVEVDKPQPTAGQVLIKVGAAGINFAETQMRKNTYPISPPLPSILGMEAAGVVEGLSQNVSGFEIGDRVGAALFLSGVVFGGYAEYVVADASCVFALPDRVSFEDATALMMQGLTALYMARQISMTKKSVLVHAGAGGVGSLLVQLARREGATTIGATASTAAKREAIKANGADLVVDYTKEGWEEDARAATGEKGFDLIYDSVGGAITSASIKALAPQGRLVFYGALNIGGSLDAGSMMGLLFGNKSITGFALNPLLTPDGARSALTELLNLADEGELKLLPGQSYPLARAADAHRAIEERRTLGKVVLVP